jgi:RNA polymerase sigma-70 factor (ECF subfamily)
MADQDNEIIERVLRGEKRAYAELVDRHKDRAMALATRMLRNRQDAEEALQDAFVRAFNALPRFERKSSFSTWFYRIVFNVCSTSLSRRGDEITKSIDAQDEEDERRLELPSDDELPDVVLESKELRQIVSQEIEAMPFVYGAILTLFLVQDLRYDEIVEVTGMPLGTVKVRLFRARELLRTAVARRIDPDQSSMKARRVVAKL